MSKDFVTYPGHLSNCIHLVGGNLAAGILLYRIYHRYNGSRFKDSNGIRWVVMYPIEWGLDTGLTSNQYKKALNLLKKKHLIRWKNLSIDKLGGGSPAWIQLDERTLLEIRDKEREILSRAKFRMAPDPPRAKRNTAPDPRGAKRPEAPPMKKCKGKSVNYKSITEQSSGGRTDNKIKFDLGEDSNVYNMEGKKMKKGAGRGIDVRNKKNHGMSIAELQARDEAKGFKTTLLHMTDLSIHWTELHCEYFDHVEVRPWTRKEIGYANSVIDKCRDRRGDDWGPYLAKMLTDMFQNFKEYAEFEAAQDRKGEQYSPSIGALASGFQTLTVWHGVFSTEEMHVHAGRNKYTDEKNAPTREKIVITSSDTKD